MPGSTREQRRLGEADRADAVVDEEDLVAGERELVAAAGAGAVERGEASDAALGADASSRERRVSFVNLQKFTLKRVRRAAEHVDVGAGAEDAVLARS